MRNALRKVVNSFSFGMDKYLPDALVLAIFLSIITFLMGIFIAGKGPLEMIQYWAGGFWGFLTFGMQMTLALTTGFVAATSPAGKRGLKKLACIPKNSVSAIIFLVFVTAVLSWLNWAVGIVAAAFLAREMANNLPKLDFKLMVAAAYTTSAGVGVFGPSGPEFLIVATPGNFLEESLGGLWPYATTMLNPATLVGIIVIFLIAIPIVIWMIHPDEKDTPLLDPKIKEKFAVQDNLAAEAIKAAKSKTEKTPAERLDNSPFWNLVIGISGLIYVVYWFSTKGFNMTLDMMNFIILMVGILLHWTPRNLLVAFEEGVRNSYGVVLQFPFYAGIQGMMAGSGLIFIIATAFASISTANTFVHWDFISAAILNIFVPSSGGLFMVQGPAMAAAGFALGVPGNQTIVAFTAGEVLSNIIQPFWAIPLLGIAGLKMKDIMGYCILFFIIAAVIFNICMAVFW